MLQQRGAQAGRAVHLACRRRGRRPDRPATSLSLMRQAPVTSKFSSARPSGSITRWHELHAGFVRCCSMRSRVDSVLPPSVALVVVERRHVGRRRRRRRAEQHFHHPLAAQHRRGAIGDRGQRQDAALAEQAAAVRVGSVTRRNCAAGDVRDAVVHRQPLVDERVVGGRAGRARCGPRAPGCRRTARSRAFSACASVSS